jgi:chromosome segregation ATPase
MRSGDEPMSKRKDDYMRGYSEGFLDCREQSGAPQTELQRALTEAKANEIYSSQLLRRFRDTLSNVRAGLEDEGDRIYFGSTNDADELRDIIEAIEELEWDRIMASERKKPDLWARIRELNEEVRALKSDRDSWRRVAERLEAEKQAFSEAININREMNEA